MNAKILALSLASLACLGCDDDGDGLDDFPPDPSFALELSVNATGDATVSQIIYGGGSSGAGETVITPFLPWTLNLTADTGDTITLQVSGTADAGDLTATIADDPAVEPLPMTYASEVCGPGAVLCEIDLSHTF